MVDNNLVPNISTVSVRVPPFWRANPTVWFCQLEAQFENSRITVDKTKYNTVVASIESDVLAQVSDVIINPPADNMYKTLKDKILERFVDSEQTRLKKLLNDLVLGDKRPSFLLQEMRQLSGTGQLDSAILKSLWLQRLPQQVQAILAVSDEELDKLATMADKILDVSRFETCSFSSSVETIASSSNNYNNLLKKVEELTKRISQLSGSNRNFRSRSRSQGNRSQSRGSGSNNGLCWYHSRYAEKASKCVPPCVYLQTQQNSEN